MYNNVQKNIVLEHRESFKAKYDTACIKDICNHQSSLSIILSNLIIQFLIDSTRTKWLLNLLSI